MEGGKHRQAARKLKDGAAAQTPPGSAVAPRFSPRPFPLKQLPGKWTVDAFDNGMTDGHGSHRLCALRGWGGLRRGGGGAGALWAEGAALGVGPWEQMPT